MYAATIIFSPISVLGSRMACIIKGPFTYSDSAMCKGQVVHIRYMSLYIFAHELNTFRYHNGSPKRLRFVTFSCAMGEKS
mgnify:CR=1 FL=1